MYSGGVAQYVLTRLINERRVTSKEITTYLGELAAEIKRIEDRLATLAAIAPQHERTQNLATRSIRHVASPRPRRHFSPAARAKQQVQGSYLGYMRQLPQHEKARFQRIREQQGFAAAITALRKHLGK